MRKPNCVRSLGFAYLPLIPVDCVQDTEHREIILTTATPLQFDAYTEAVAKLGRQPRAGQQELVARGTNLEEGSRLLVRAPTATGKSLAALLIAGFRWERNDGHRTIIATYTKLLQDQYSRTSTDPELQTDLDQARLLFPGMSFAVLKGAGNYLCRKIAAGHVRKGRADGYAELAEGEGDPGEVKDFTGGPVWKAKADPKRCREHSADECGFMAAKDRARKANCVVTNHALVVLNASNPAILGEHSLLVVDECFVPTALVDTPAGPRPIGDLVEGDEVYGFDELRGIVTVTTVRATMSREADVIGEFVTPNHPVRVVGDAYRPVADLRKDDLATWLDCGAGVPTVRHEVLSTGTQGTQWQKVLHQIVQGQCTTRVGTLESWQRQDDSGADLCWLWSDVQQPRRASSVLYQRLLLGQRRARMGTAEHLGSPRTARSADAIAGTSHRTNQSISESRSSQAGSRHTIGSGLANADGREREANAETRSSFTGDPGPNLDSGVCDFNIRLSLPRATDPLQGGPWARSQETSRRSGRLVAPHSEATGARPEEGIGSEVLWMDGSEVRQPRDLGRYREVCAANTGDRRTVVNIETGTHNYFVNGLLVHNCHNLPRAAESMATVTLDLTEMAIEAEQSGEDGEQEAAMLRLVQRSINQGDIWNDRIPSVEELQRLAEVPRLNLNADVDRWVNSAARYYQARQERRNPAWLSTVAKKGRYDADGKRTLKLSVIDIGRVTQRALRTTVDVDEETSFDRAVLMMSATVGTPSKPTYVADRCGVDAELLKVTSALDYPSQMQVSLLDLPSGWSFAEAVTQLCKETGGRTLVLCRSWKMVNAIKDHLFDVDLPFRVFIQDQEYSSNNGGVVTQFKADETSVLVGTASFFEGIDIPGESLSQVVITQLPMLMTMSPLEEERKRRLGSRFIPDSQIPHTALVLEQMMGRLIRSTSDRGVCVVLDPMAQSGWGATAVKHAVEAFGSPCVSRKAALNWLGVL